MQNESDDALVGTFVASVNSAPDELAARHAYRAAFDRLRRHLTLHPLDASPPSAVFESAAITVQRLACRCLPLAIAVVMHLYPLCALQCVPLPRLSAAHFRRALLLRRIRRLGLMLANVGGERVRGVDQPLIARKTRDGIRIDGACEYMSLGSVADIALFKAKLADGGGAALCAADLDGASVARGDWKFRNSMRLSDTSSVTFTNHLVPRGRYLISRDDSSLRCVSTYQRSWFHLLIAEAYRSRLERVRADVASPATAQHIEDLARASELRTKSLRLLDEIPSTPDLDALAATTGLLKLRVSTIAQSTAEALRASISAGLTAEDSAANAAELDYLKWQPTADSQLLQALGDAAHTAVPITCTSAASRSHGRPLYLPAESHSSW